MPEDNQTILKWSEILGNNHYEKNDLELFYTSASISRIYGENQNKDIKVAYYKALENINNKSELTKNWLLDLLKKLEWKKVAYEIEKDNQEFQSGNCDKNVRNDVDGKQNKNNLPNDLIQLKNKEWNVPNKEKDFVGREDKLKKLNAFMQNGNKTLITACVGLGGIGKTFLTVEYIRTNKDNYNKVIWFKAELPELLKEEFLLFGNDVGATKKENKELGPILNWFVNNPGWLIVFDNVETPESIQDYTPPSGGKILITRNGSLFETANKIELNLYTLDEVSIYLQRKVPEQYKEAKSKNLIEKFANELNFHPLALTQAVCYMREAKRSVEWYLKKKEKQKSLHLKTTDQKFLQYYSCVLDSLMISIKKFLRDDEVMSCLQIIAFLAPEKIPRVLFTDSILISLDQYSVIKLDDDLFFSIHRLVQESMRFIMGGNSNDEEFKGYFSGVLSTELDKAYNFLNFSYPFGKMLKEDLELKSHVLPHFVAIMNYFQLNMKKEERLSLSKIEIQEVPQLIDEMENCPILTEIWNKNPVVDSKINFENALQKEDIDEKILVLTQTLNIFKEELIEDDEMISENLIQLAFAYSKKSYMNKSEAFLQQAKFCFESSLKGKVPDFSLLHSFKLECEGYFHFDKTTQWKNYLKAYEIQLDFFKRSIQEEMPEMDWEPYYRITTQNRVSAGRFIFPGFNHFKGERIDIVGFEKGNYEIEVFVGRGKIGEDLIPGKFIPIFDSFQCSNGEKEIKLQNFEVLKMNHCRYKWVLCSNGDVVSKAVVGGKDANGETFYIGRVYISTPNNPTEPSIGKIQKSRKGCIVPYWNKEYLFLDYEVLVGI